MEDNNKKIETVPEKEERILQFWNDNKIFEKTLKKPARTSDSLGVDAPKGSASSADKEFVFYDGPPFATGEPHYGHLLQSILKDVIPRYKTMRGYRVPRQWGWDCHGLPVENLIEKELGLKTKKDIEDLGVAKFNKAAKDSVLRYADEWKKIIPRFGRFVDMENDYRTMDPNYTESVWWVFKTLFDKGLVYLGHKSMHICPRCETTLANFEVAQGYKDITDLSLTAKFELIDDPIRTDGSNESTSNGAGPGVFVLAWTTTPWTLPGNVALAVGENIDYVKIEKDGIKLILAKDRLSKIEGEYKIIEEFKGSKLIGKSYKPLFDYYSKKEDLENRENGWKIYGASFVTTDDGTGIVHIAPAFGDDDMKLGKEKRLPFVQHVGMDGKFRPEVSDFAGIQVKPKDEPKASLGQVPNSSNGQAPQSTDVLIIKNLAGRGLLFGKEKITHSYPHCWRCDTPLLNYAASSWFINIQKIKSKIIDNVKKSNWVPQNIRDGRFINLIEDAPDWNISRSRYWGAPLPIWKCKKCDELKVVGSISDIKKETNSGNKYFVMRHGECDSVVNGILMSEKTEKDNHLTEKGKEQVLISANNLLSSLNGEKFDFIYSSDFVRTRETAEIVAEEAGYPKEKIVYDERLREIKLGDFDGKTTEEYENYFADYEERFVKSSPNGENHNEIKKRMMDILFEIDGKYKGKNILIISHGDPIWVLLAGARGLNPKETALMRKPEGVLEPADFKKFDFSHFPHNENYELDLHKPFIDEITFSCVCGEKMKRVPEVFDCWFESGAMPYGQKHYPFENKESFENNFPAEFIGEAVDQTRGWFYTLMVLSTALFDKPAFKNVITTGLILAEDGQKMSKRLKNYPEVSSILNKYGADATRYYLLTSPVVKGEEVRFTERGVDEVYKKIILRLSNVYSFLEMYEGSEKRKTKNEKQKTSQNVLDTWIMARLDEITNETTDALEKYEIDKAARPIEGFVDDLSTWYLRRSRDRFRSEDKEDKENALNTLKFVIKNLCILISPIMPFIADDLYQKLNYGENKESVHLENWPDKLITDFPLTRTSESQIKNDREILEKMKLARRIVSLGLEARMRAGIKVRQPLNELRIRNYELWENKEYQKLIKDELNIKEIVFDKNQNEDVLLNTEVTEELKGEGNLRELVRNIQEARKKFGMLPTDKIFLKISTSSDGEKFIKKFETEIKKLAGVKNIEFLAGEEGEKIVVDGMEFKVSLRV